MDLAQRLVIAQRHLVIEGLGNLRQRLEHLVNGTEQEPRAHLLRRRVDGNPRPVSKQLGERAEHRQLPELLRPLGLLRILAQQHELGVLQLRRMPEKFQLAGDDHARARPQHAEDPHLAEERGLEAVVERHVDNPLARARVGLSDVDDGRGDGDVLALDGPAGPDIRRAAQVCARIVREQVATRGKLKGLPQGFYGLRRQDVCQRPVVTPPQHVPTPLRFPFRSPGP